MFYLTVACLSPQTNKLDEEVRDGLFQDVLSARIANVASVLLGAEESIRPSRGWTFPILMPLTQLLKGYGRHVCVACIQYSPDHKRNLSSPLRRNLILDMDYCCDQAMAPMGVPVHGQEPKR